MITEEEKLRSVIKSMVNEELSIEESIYDKNIMKAIFIMGGGGSGKSAIVKEIRNRWDGLGVKVINSDDLFEHLLRKNDLPFDIDSKNRVIYNKQMDVRAAARDKTKKKRENIIDSMLPMIIDGTGSRYDEIEELHDYLVGVGYDTAAVIVLVEPETALARNRRRERKVPEEVLLTAHKDLRTHLSSYQNLFGVENVKFINNEDSFVHNSEKAQKEFDSIYKMYISSPLKNKKGHDIINKLREIKGKFLTDLKPE